MAGVALAGQFFHSSLPHILTPFGDIQADEGEAEKEAGSCLG